jgi:hypothetical protein
MNATTLTFPSGATVDLPEGITPCTNPEGVTYDCSRSVPVGTTPAGQVVFSGFSCGAYAYASTIYSMRKTVAEDRASADKLAARGRTWQAGNLRRNADEREARDNRIIARMAADPAPCTC